MENNQEQDSIIKSQLSYIASRINNSEDSLQDILIEIKRRQEKGKIYSGFNKYILITCIVCVLLAAPLAFSANVRAMADDMLNSVKMVFVIDKSNQTIERSASEVIINPAVTMTTQLSDEELSKKMGFNLCIPQILYKNYSLQNKYEAVAFNKKLSYETFDKIRYTAEKAINDEAAFKSLKEYEPYKSVGFIYRDSSGKSVYINVLNTLFHISTENRDNTVIIQTKVGKIKADWVSTSYTDYNGGDMTQKPIGKVSIHALFWSTDNATYEILTNDSQPLSMDESIKIAEVFMKAQN